jgi:hypothetical protein
MVNDTLAGFGAVATSRDMHRVARYVQEGSVSEKSGGWENHGIVGGVGAPFLNRNDGLRLHRSAVHQQQRERGMHTNPPQAHHT